LSARARRGLLVGVVAAFVAALAVGNAAAATPNVHRMYVNPIMSLVPDASATSSYGLRSCQTQQTAFGACYDPYQMRHAYGVDSLIANGYDGTGKTIVILDAFDDTFLQSDFDLFNSMYGLPNQTIAQYYPGGQANTPYDAGWSQEMQLDVDWSHAIAPGAKIVIVHGKSNSDQDLVAAANYAIDNNLGDVISMSFGESDQCLGSDLTKTWHSAFVNATKKGITLFASSGDQGASQPSCNGNSWIQSTSSPASDPLVTGVGGTELNASGWDPCATPRDTSTCTPTGGQTPGTWLSETGWNEGPTGDFANVFGATEATGGGYSTVWSEPAYQQGTLHGGKQRAVPDVAYNGAILHGVLVPLPEFGGVFRFGGTSCGSPQWAALMAIADQAAGHDYGFINSALYKVGQNSGPYAAAFNDVLTGNNNAVEFDNNNNEVDISGFNAGTGWDALTGLGSPKAGGLLSGLAANWSAGQGNAAIVGSSRG
jgi:subtilase family serine protease